MCIKLILPQLLDLLWWKLCPEVSNEGWNSLLSEQWRHKRYTKALQQWSSHASMYIALQSQLRWGLVMSISSILLHCFTATSHVAWKCELRQPPLPLRADFQWGYLGYPRISHDPHILRIMWHYPTFDLSLGIIDPKDQDQSLGKLQGSPDPRILSHE